MRRKADRDKQEGPTQDAVEAQQKALGKTFTLFRIVIAILAACALGAASVAFMLMNA